MRENVPIRTPGWTCLRGHVTFRAVGDILLGYATRSVGRAAKPKPRGVFHFWTTPPKRAAALNSSAAGDATVTAIYPHVPQAAPSHVPTFHSE